MNTFNKLADGTSSSPKGIQKLRITTRDGKHVFQFPEGRPFIDGEINTNNIMDPYELVAEHNKKCISIFDKKR